MIVVDRSYGPTGSKSDRRSGQRQCRPVGSPVSEGALISHPRNSSRCRVASRAFRARYRVFDTLFESGPKTVVSIAAAIGTTSPQTRVIDLQVVKS